MAEARGFSAQFGKVACISRDTLMKRKQCG